MAQTIQELTTDIRNSVADRGNGKTTQELVREIRDAVKNGIIKESDVRRIVAELTDGAPEELDTFKEVQDYLETLYTKDEIDDAIANIKYTAESDPTVPLWAKQPNPPTYTANDVGAIPLPGSASSGAFLVYDGTAWVAQTLSEWQGGSY